MSRHLAKRLAIKEKLSFPAPLSFALSFLMTSIEMSRDPSRTDLAEVGGSSPAPEDPHEGAPLLHRTQHSDEPTSSAEGNFGTIPEPAPVQTFFSIPYDSLTRDMLGIALPALFALACDPIASIVDSIYIGRLGAADLAGAGAAIALFNLLSKLLNNPLLSVTTSLIATATGAATSATEAVQRVGSAGIAALILAMGSGLIQLILLGPLGPFLLRGAGIRADGPMYPYAKSMLLIRAMGAPVTAGMLVSQGIFRGLKDTK